jgi:hypothetical protein
MPNVTLSSCGRRFSACLAVLVGACTAGPRGPSAGTQQIEDFVQWQGRIELQGGPAISNTLPTVYIDPFGEFIVADLRETQIRRYSNTGRLLASFGREGPGAGEFRRLSAAVRQGDGNILGFDMGGTISVFDSTGVHKVDHATEVAPIYDVARIDDSRIAIAGRRIGSANGPLIHIWDNRSHHMLNSFFPVPPHAPQLDGAYMLTGSADVVSRGDTLAAVFARTDTLYLFHSNGTPIAKIKIPFRRFRAITAAPAPTASRQEILAWRQTFSTVSQVFWAPDGSFYIQYFDLTEVEPQWRLVHMTRQGRRLFDVADTPRLLAIAPDSRLFFLDPASDERNVWKIGKALSRG